MPKGVPNKRYTPEFKKLVIETMQEEKLSYSETCRRFEVNSRDRIKSWERIYLEEGPEGFAVERRGRSSKGRPPKQLPKQVEEDLLAEVQRLRAENDYKVNLKTEIMIEDLYDKVNAILARQTRHKNCGSSMGATATKLAMRAFSSALSSFWLVPLLPPTR